MLFHSVRLVKELKGAALSVVVALTFAGGVPVSQEWLERNTGYTDKPVSRALAYLLEHGMIKKIGGGWLPDEEQVRQLPLPMEFESVASRNISDSPSSIINVDFNKEIKDSLNTTNDSRNYSDYPELGEALKSAGIRENVRTRRLLGRITTEDVAAVLMELRDDPLHSQRETGLVVTMLEARAEKAAKGGYGGWNE